MQLADLRLEAFARHLALGLCPAVAARAAGYSPQMVRVKSSMMSKRPVIRSRVEELRATLAASGSCTGPASEMQVSANHDAARSAGWSFSADGEPNREPQLPSIIAPGDGHEAFVEARREALSDEPIDRAWLTRLLRVVAADAVAARDRRAAIAAADALSRLNGLQAPQRTEVTSPLAGLGARELLQLLELLDRIERENVPALGCGVAEGNSGEGATAAGGDEQAW
jgi:hypothetical protein